MKYELEIMLANNQNTVRVSNMNSPATIQTALAELLLALKFNAMAEECRTETRHEYLCRYARIVLRQGERAGWDYSKRLKLASLFKMAGVA